MTTQIKMVSGALPVICAGLVAKDGKVIDAAPILRYMIGWPGRQVKDYSNKKKWTIL